MKLGRVRRSGNVEDRRGRRRKAAAGGGIGLLLLVGIVLLQGGGLGDVLRVFQQQGKSPLQQQQQSSSAPLSPQQKARQDEQIAFVEKVLALTEDVWHEQFSLAGRKYEEPRLVVFRDVTDTACGEGSAAMGPFYCPADRQVYIDLSFYDQLDQQLDAPGDFAQAYVVAHEVAHHIQNQLGYSDRVHRARQRLSKEQANRMSVRLELQADYLAGVWAHHAHKRDKILEAGDIEEGLHAARAIGDDMLQRLSRGHVVPENFTHGTSAQRAKWLRQGLETGDASRRALDQLFDLRYEDL
ncbi:MAG: neutral zinc metallopeptidase [Planctomycetota bacterium]